MDPAATFSDFLITLLEWLARAAILVVAWTVKMIFSLQSDKKLIEADLEREIKAREASEAAAKEQRAEFLTLVKDTNDKVDKLRDEQTSAHRELLTAIHNVANSR